MGCLERKRVKLAVVQTEEEEVPTVVADEVWQGQSLEVQTRVVKEGGFEEEGQVVQLEEQTISEARVPMSPTNASPIISKRLENL